MRHSTDAWTCCWPDSLVANIQMQSPYSSLKFVFTSTLFVLMMKARGCNFGYIISGMLNSIILARICSVTYMVVMYLIERAST